MTREPRTGIWFGAIQKSLAGAGVANSEDATAIAINPAGLVDVGQQFNGSIFVPRHNVSGPVPAAFCGGSVTLSLEEFAAGWSYRFDSTAAPLVAKY